MTTPLALTGAQWGLIRDARERAEAIDADNVDLTAMMLVAQAADELARENAELRAKVAAALKEPVGRQRVEKIWRDGKQEYSEWK